MKTIARVFFLSVLFLVCQASASDLGDRLKRAFGKAADKVSDVAEKVEIKSRSWYSQARERLRLTREDYIKRSDKQLDKMSAQIVALKEVTGQNAREYFKTRLLALQQHLSFAEEEFGALQLSPTEEQFRARQKGFDYTVNTLESAIFQAQDEAGL
jgi:hypothetical protein